MSIRRKINLGSVRKLRWIVRLLSFAFFMFGGFLWMDLGNDIPTFTCPYVDSRAGNCFLFGLQHRLVIPVDQILTMRGLGVLMSFVGFFLWFMALNKAWCGFVCPLGAMQDALGWIRVKLGFPYGEYGVDQMKRLSKIKYILLFLLVFIPLGIANSLPGVGRLDHDWATPYCMICPARVILPLFIGDTSQLALDFSSGVKLGLTLAGLLVAALFVVGSLIKRRFFCLFCPMSAMHYLFSKAAFLKLIKDGDKCTRCGNCYRACDMGIHEIADQLNRTNMTTENCMLCLDCVASCPEEGCLKVTFLGKSIYEATEEGFFKRQEEEIKNEPKQ